MSGATFPKFPRSSCPYSGWISHKKCCSTGTGNQKECRAWNSVVFAKIQCRSVQHVERIQGCYNNVPGSCAATDASNCKRLTIISVLDSNHVINGLITELPKYVAAAHNVTMAWRTKWSSGDSTQIDCHIGRLQSWKFLQVQPSSAAAERVFSIINCFFNDSQDHALVDYVQACVMLQYNKRW